MLKKRIIKEHKKKGLIAVFTGNGKGKTTSAIGNAVRAAGHGMKSIMIQFMKGTIHYGELDSANKLLKKYFRIIPMGKGCTWEIKDKEQYKKNIKKTWEFSKNIILSNKYSIVILDEINCAISYGFLNIDDVIGFLKKKPEQIHVILTGRDADKKLAEIADLVTEMKEIKHQFKKGISAQKGIEY